MPQNFFISGMPKAGKTTLLARMVAELKSHGLRVGGFISPEETEHGTRTGFYVKDVDSGEIGLLAGVDADGPMVSKYHVDLKSFENIALPPLRRFEEYDVIVIDEIGRMELKSQKFSDALDRVLESSTPLIASLHSDFIGRYGQTGQVIFLEENNHEAAYRELVEDVKAIVKGREAADAASRKAVVMKKVKAARAVKKLVAKTKAKKMAKMRRGTRRREAKKAVKRTERKARKKARAKEVKKDLIQHLRDIFGF
jgi:nucleoside-triphosphatase